MDEISVINGIKIYLFFIVTKIENLSSFAPLRLCVKPCLSGKPPYLCTHEILQPPHKIPSLDWHSAHGSRRLCSLCCQFLASISFISHRTHPGTRTFLFRPTSPHPGIHGKW